MDEQDEMQILIERAMSGDRKAFDDLAAKHRDGLESRIRSQLRGSLHRSLDAKELLQETLVQALGSIGRFRWQGERSYGAWLNAIARNVVLKAIRQWRRHRTLEIGPEVPGIDVSPSRAARRAERLDRLQSAVG